MEVSQETIELLKKVRKIELNIRGVVNQLFAGEYHSVFKGRGIEFAEVREYQAGDDVRTIDWNVTARMNHPYVKNFHEERENSVIIAVDVSSSLLFGTRTAIKKELAVEIAALLASSAIQNNDKVGLLLFSELPELFIPPRKGKKHIFRIIRELLVFKPRHSGTDIGAGLEYLNHVVKKRSTVFLLSDLWDKGFEKPLKIIGKKHDVVVLQFMDPFELDAPSPGLYRFTDVENNSFGTVDLNSKANREAIKTNIDKHQDWVEKVLKKHSIDRVVIRSDENYVIPLTRFFKFREKRKR